MAGELTKSRVKDKKKTLPRDFRTIFACFERSEAGQSQKFALSEPVFSRAMANFW
jgi:hypothetical protein